MNKTYIPKISKKSKHYLIDAKNQTLGRLSSKIARLLRGKNNTAYTPHIVNSTHIIIINSKFIQVSGKKNRQKIYRKHSGRPGGLKEESFEKLQRRLPERIIEKAIKGMLPKGSLGKKLFNYLKVYSTNEYPHREQKIEEILLH